MSNLNSTQKLTEFPPLELEDQDNASKFSLSRFMFWKKPDGPETASTTSSCQAVYGAEGGGPSEAISNVSLHERRGSSPATSGTRISLTIPSHCKTESQPSPEITESNASSSPVFFEPRNVPNVLRRLANLMGSNNQADLKKFWMPDSVSKECLDCEEKFTAFRRKHHCRICGQIFCSRCCNQFIPGKIIGYTGDLRVCVYCCKTVLSYLHSADINADLEDDMKAVQEDLQNRFGPASGDFGVAPSSGTLTFDSSSSGYRSLSRRRTSACYQEEKFAGSKDHSFDTFHANVGDKPKVVWDWVSLKSMWEEMHHPVTGIDWATHRHNMMKYCHSCVVGSELIDWLLSQRKITWRGQGVQIGQLLIDANLLECVSQQEQVFLDAYALYKPIQVPLSIVQESSEPSSSRNSTDLGDGKDWGQDPLWLKQITNPERRRDNDETSKVSENLDSAAKSKRISSSASLYSVDLNVGDNVVSMSKPKDTTVKESHESEQIQRGSSTRFGSATTETMTDEFLQKTLQSQKNKDKDLVAPVGWHSPQQLTTDSEVRTFQKLCNAYVQHENDILNQLLSSMNLSSTWADIILPIVRKVTEIVRPDVRNADDEMDIRQYIRFKKLPGGAKSDCRIVNGVVFTKNVVHKHMRSRLKDPNVLLIGSSIDYQRFENKFLSLEPLVMQENDYLKNIVARILALKPDIVVVEKTVSRIAQELMLEQGITLIINVKPAVMERIARLTQGGIWESADTQLGRPQLGLCHNFYLETFEVLTELNKTLMFFDGCATHLGCSVLLRGGTAVELAKVKKITSFLMFVAYNWRLERSFHIDSFAMPLDNLQNVEDTPLNNQESSDQSVSVNISNTEISFTEVLKNTILSASPFIKYPLPYLETTTGKQCSLRRFFPEIMYWSPKPRKPQSIEHVDLVEEIECDTLGLAKTVCLNSKTVAKRPVIIWEPSHSFSTSKLTTAVNSDEVQDLLADFRRKGSRLKLPVQGSLPDKACRSNTSSWNTLENDKVKQSVEEEIDALNPFKHQRLSVLFSSYSPNSNNSPYFCVNPWVVNMDMYGRNDISLGMFLERYCFRKSYFCPATMCETPMMDHIRKFVHHNGCVDVILRELKTPIAGSGQNILMWNWCSLCYTVSPIVPMSVDSWSLSFAKYLELRFYGGNYKRRTFDNPCGHSLHQNHQHYFAQQNVVATFIFSPIQLLEVSLPRLRINVGKTPNTIPTLIDNVKAVTVLSHGVYSNIFEVLSSLKETVIGYKVEDIITALIEQLKVEKNALKSKIEDIQLDLSSPNLTAAEESLLWSIEDSIGFLKCNIAETIQSWNTYINNFIVQKKKEEKLFKDNSSKSSKLDSDYQALSAKEDIIKRKSGSEFCVDSAYGDNDDTPPLEQSVASVDGPVVDAVINSSPMDLTSQKTLYPSNISGSSRHHERSRSDGSDKLVNQDECDVAKLEKKSGSSAVKTLISHFISGPGGSMQVLQVPWGSSLHYFYAASSCIPIPIYENEPSSIVAHALSCKEYNAKLKAFYARNKQKPSGSSEAQSKAVEELQSSSSSHKSIQFDDKVEAVDESKSKQKDGNIQLQFASMSANFYCCVYFPDEFLTLRKLFLVEGEEFYVRSLARCVAWAASGGKSGLTFCKTVDDRFVIKQMSRFEIQSFLDIAPNYFEYIKSAHSEKKPTVLAKILGVYRIGFKNFVTNSQLKMDILVMENLFYGRKISQKFDLKGSIRNRLANVTAKGQEELVLLDENLVNMACECPMYIRPHTKTVLTLALSNDSKFLASQMVMDYSLLVGVDESKKELVVGIIDYIRTFTWDKKIETFVKSSGILGGQGKTPTVVSPTEYQTRFCEAMDRYFLLVPDRWLGLGLDLHT